MLLTGDSDEEHLDTVESFKEDLPLIFQVMEDFMNAVAKKSGVNGRAFVILDDTTAKDKSTCLVAADVRGDNSHGIDYTGFRCQFSSALSALEPLIHGSETIREMRNEAAMAGGVWSKSTLDKIKSRKPRIDASKFPLSKHWNTGCGTMFHSDKPYYPVF